MGCRGSLIASIFFRPLNDMVNWGVIHAVEGRTGYVVNESTFLNFDNLEKYLQMFSRNKCRVAYL